MIIHIDEPLAVMAATAFAAAGAVLGAWWQRRRSVTNADHGTRDTDPRLMDTRFDRLEQFSEAMALELERIAEAQRFTAKLMAERTPGTPAIRPSEHHTPH